MENGGTLASVAVRILRDDAPALDQALFLREVANLRALTHTNLLHVLGCCCDSQPLLILMDLCPKVSPGALCILPEISLTVSCRET